jgi:GNAT superfamily N-acetyltransferase
MHASLRIRLLAHAEMPFADRVRDLAGWNQTIDDWKRFLAVEPDGCFLAEWEGHPAGTMTTTRYGTTLAWIGMVLVHPDYRRRGIGRALLQHGVAHLRGRGVECIKLDATPVGKTVYVNLGFEAEWSLARWAGRVAAAQEKSSGVGLRPWRSTDLAATELLDVAAFGVWRQHLLAALAKQSLAALVVESSPGRVAGFGLLRPGSRAIYLGPVIAASEQAGLALVERLVARSEGQLIYWDIPDQNAAAVSWAERHGFTRQRPLTRMYLGKNPLPGDPHRQFALSGPETG